MSQTQQSTFSSSIYDGDLDLIPYSQFTPDFSESQETLPTEDFLRPAIPSSIPLCLTRVGPNRVKNYLLYDEMVHNEWLETGYGKKHNIPWDATHQSTTWNDFHQVANISDGAPKVMCKRCGQILEHPNFVRETKDGRKPRQGTSTMKTHLKTAACVKASQGQKSDITRFLQKNVPDVEEFSQERWEQGLLTFIADTRLPFQLVEHPAFHKLIQQAQSAPLTPSIPSAKIYDR
ncbi:hypothetical protein N7534_005643 [Penicillium rubens]|nr:hypothetical protein N7534_005643 [Penicillium rubens]